MLNVSKWALVQEMKQRFVHTKSWIQYVGIQNVRAKKSYAFEPHMKYVLNALRQLLTCTESKAYSIYDRFPSIRSIDKMRTVGNNIEILMSNDITLETIIDNPFLLIMTEDAIQAKLNLLNKLNLRGNKLTDFVPLMELKADRFQQVIASMLEEESRISGGNRIYYFSNKMSIEPNIVSKYCARNEYLLVAPFEIVDRKVQILLDYNIKPMSILKCLYSLDRSESLYLSRLDKLMMLNIQDVKLYFFTCADEAFEKYLSKLDQVKIDGKDKIEPQDSNKIHIENELNELLECENEESAYLYYNQISNVDQIDNAKQNIEFLKSLGVSLETITDTPAVLVMPLNQLKQKLHVLDDLNPRCIDDFLPLISMDAKKLHQFKKTLEELELDESNENPIYYFSEKLKVTPSKVSSHFARNPIIYLQSPKMLQQKLDTLLTFSVQLDSILNTPEAFRKSLSQLERRLRKMKSSALEPILAWMVTCEQSKINAMIKVRDEQKEALQGCNDVVDYLASRLKWDDETKANALKSNPAITKCNITKIKQMLDFLLNETHFTEDDISSCPRVFRNSLKTLQTRLNELASVEYKPNRLYIICLDRRRYLQFVEKHCQSINNANVWCKFREIEKSIKGKLKWPV